MDKYDVLMNLKRQGPTTSGSGTGTPTPTRTASASASASPSATASPSPSASASPSASPSATPTQSASSNPPLASSVPSTTSSSTVPATTSTVPSSTPVTTSSSVPVTSASSTPASASSSAPITTATSTIATSAGSSAALTTTTPRTVLTVSGGTASYIRTTSGGLVFTVTAIVGQPSASASAAAKKPFFQNTGAVVGVFVVVGVVAAALAVFLITLFIRRRRAKQFDRDVQEAAREAAQTQAPIDDDDYTGGASYNTHASQPMSTERPGYGGVATGYGVGAAAASSWDPYGRATTGTTGYEMQHRRTSTGTAPGMAGFGAGDSFARAVGVDAPQGYNQPQGYGPGYGQQGYNNQGQAYNNTSPPQAYALAQDRGQGRAPPKPQMMMPEANRHQSYNTVDAFRAGPSYGEAHPGEHVEYGHADNGGYGYAYSGESQAVQRQDGGYPAAQNVSPGRQSEDPYGGYEQYDAYAQGSNSADASAVLPAYASGTGNAGATGDRKGNSGQGASVGRQPSGKSANTRYSQDDSEGSVDERPQRRVLKIANSD